MAIVDEDSLPDTVGELLVLANELNRSRRRLLARGEALGTTEARNGRWWNPFVSAGANRAYYLREAAAKQVRLDEVLKKLERLRTGQEDEPEPALAVFSAQPPAHSVSEATLSEAVPDLEALLVAADEYYNDERNPAEMRAAVHIKRVTLRGELTLFGVEPDAIMIARAAGFIIATLADQLPETAATGQLAGGVQALGEDATAAAGAAAVSEVLDEVMAGPEPGVGPERPYADALKAGARRWLEHDLFEKHLNHLVTGSMTTAGVVVVGTIGTGQAPAMWAVLVRAARVLVRIRFPWLWVP